MRTIILTIISLICIQRTFSQIATEAVLASDQFVLQKAPTVNLPGIPLEQLLAEDELDSQKGLPLRFGCKLPMRANLKNSGSWTSLDNGDRVWRLRVVARAAYSINFLFDHFRLAPGARLFLYNDDKSYTIGAFTKENEQADGKFATAPVKGQAVTLELVEPAEEAGKSALTIAEAVHAYIDLFEEADRIRRNFGSSGACNIDVACREAGWEDQVSSVGIVIVGGNRECSGSMINNTMNHGTPYFLTASHCDRSIKVGDLLSTYVFVFNYESPRCNGPDGNLSQSVSGGVLKARFSDSDMLLIELSSPPPPSYNVFYSGWDRRDIPADTSVCIHHPRGDVKKISFNYHVNVSSSGLSGVSDAYWRVTQWEDGTTEGGSSGAPLFDQNRRIVGHLHGGRASCINIDRDDFGKLYASWDGGGSPESRLSDWLDPADKGDLFIEGTRNFTRPTFDIDVLSVLGTSTDICDSVFFPEVIVRNLGTSTLTKFTLDYQFDNNPVQQLTLSGLNIATSGTYTVPLGKIDLPEGSHTLTINLSAPNDSVDQVSTNNQLTTSFNSTKGTNVHIRLLADEISENIQLFVRRQSDNSLVWSEDDIRFAAFNDFDLCLKNDCYSLTITDAEGNGLDGGFLDGYLLLEVAGFSIDSIDAFFRDSASVDFCIPLPVQADFSIPDTVCGGVPIVPDERSIGPTTYQWVAEGATPPTSDERFPSFEWNNPGDYEVTLIASSAGGGIDSVKQWVHVEDGAPLSIKIQTDLFPEETSYKLVDEAGNLIVSRDKFGGANNLFQESLCLSPGCYRFIILDSSRDGLCCNFGNGYYEILAENERLLGLGAQFRDSDTVSFCLYNVAIEAETVDANLRLYPNPSTRKVYIESDEQLLQWGCYDLFGKKIMKGRLRGTKDAIDVYTLRKGMYFMKIQTAKGWHSRRFIKH